MAGWIIWAKPEGGIAGGEDWKRIGRAGWKQAAVFKRRKIGGISGCDEELRVRFGFICTRATFSCDTFYFPRGKKKPKKPHPAQSQTDVENFKEAPLHEAQRAADSVQHTPGIEGGVWSRWVHVHIHYLLARDMTDATSLGCLTFKKAHWTDNNAACKSSLFIHFEWARFYNRRGTLRLQQGSKNVSREAVKTAAFPQEEPGELARPSPRYFSVWRAERREQQRSSQFKTHLISRFDINIIVNVHATFLGFGAWQIFFFKKG